MDARTSLCQLFLSGAFTNYQLLLLARHAADFPHWQPWLAAGQRRTKPAKCAQQTAILTAVLADRPVAPPIAAGTQLLTVLDSAYPLRLLEIYDPPAVLHCAGHLALLTQRTVGVVGTRTCSAYGQAAAAALVPPLCAADVAIVSGFTRGIDSLAHRLAMGAAGSTIGVIGNGLTHFYPREHTVLQQVMMHDQLVLSPFPPTTPPRPYQFPQRNRIIAGLSHALLVIEARERSGSLITASLAQDANRLVAAVPGRICDPLSAGCNALIADGAIPVHSAADLLRELPDKAF